MAGIHQALVKMKPQFLVLFLIDFQQPFFPIRFADQYFQILRFARILIIKDILDLFVIDRKQDISCFDLHLFRDTARIYFYDRMFTQFSLPYIS